MMKKMYSTKMINTGGRSGEVHSPDHSFELNITAPGKRVENATNPEQLFAAGFSACFKSYHNNSRSDFHPNNLKMGKS